MRILALLIFLLMGCQSPAPILRQPASEIPLAPERLENRLQSFTARGCPTLSSSISYGSEDQWSLCCVAHNRDYWKGGSKADRLQSDSRLHSCITQRGYPEIAQLILYRLKGHADEKQTWGYGWQIERGYASFTEKEKDQVAQFESQIPRNLSEVRQTQSSTQPESLTQNQCLDEALRILQSDLGKSVAPRGFMTESQDQAIGFETRYKITLQECPLPYEFTFETQTRNDCLTSARAPASRIQLKGIFIPEPCR